MISLLFDQKMYVIFCGYAWRRRHWFMSHGCVVSVVDHGWTQVGGHVSSQSAWLTTVCVCVWRTERRRNGALKTLGVRPVETKVNTHTDRQTDSTLLIDSKARASGPCLIGSAAAYGNISSYSIVTLKLYWSDTRDAT